MAKGGSIWTKKLGKAGSEEPIDPIEPKQKAPRKKAGKSGLTLVAILLLLLVVVAVVVFVMLPKFTGSDEAASPATTVLAESTPPAASTTTSTVPKSTTTTTAAPPITVPITVTLHNSYRTSAYFSYPATWTAFPLEDFGSLDAYQGQSFGAGDIHAYPGEDPRDGLQFSIRTVPDGDEVDSATEIVDDIADSKISNPWNINGHTTIQSTTNISLNGVAAAECVLRLSKGDTKILMRVCAVVSQRTQCVFYLYTEEKNKDKYWPEFEKTLQSLRLGANKASPLDADPAPAPIY